MKAIMNLGWRRWATILLGASMFASPCILGISGEEASSVNSWIIGICLVLVAWRVPIVSGPLATGLASIMLGVWLLASPFALDFAGTTTAWGAWVTGALTVALSASPAAIFDLAAWLQACRLRRGVRSVSLQQIVRGEKPEYTISPDVLCRWIVERSYRIQRTMREHPSEMEAGMCASGYRACVSDMLTLVRMIDTERAEAGVIRGLRLRAARDIAAHSLSRARQTLPADALRVTNV